MLPGTTLLALVLSTLAPAATTPRVSVTPFPVPCAATTHIGIFRVTAMHPDSTGLRPAMIVLENINGCLEATLITDEARPAVIDHLEYAGDTLSGTVRTGNGTAHVQLQFDDAGVAGSITEGAEHWVVRGRRTA